MIAQGIAALVGVVGFALLGSTFGRLWLRRLGVSAEECKEPLHLLGALGVGWAAISLLLLGLGALGAFHARAFLLLLVGCGVLGVRHVLPVIRDWRTLWGTWRAEQSQASFLERWVVRLVGAHMVVSLVATLAPPTFWDALVYHIGLPKLFLWHRQVVGVDGGNLLASSHLATQMLYAIGLSVENEVWPALLHWLFGVLTTVSLYWMGRSWWHHEAGVWAASCLYATPLMNTLGGGPLIDLALAFYTCLALWCFGTWVAAPRLQEGILIGFFAGCVAGTKYSGLGILALFAGLVALSGVRQRRAMSALATSASILLIGCVVVSPWFLKVHVEYGTPWFLMRTIRTLGWPRAVPIWQTVTLQSPVAEGLWILWKVVTYPLTITLQPLALDGWRSSAGPWLVSLVPLLLCCRVEQRLRWLLGFSGLALVGTCLLSTQFNRYLMPIYPAIALICGCILWQSAAWGGRTKQCLQGIVCAWSIVNLGLLLAQDGGRLPVVIGLESRETYLSRRIDSFPVMHYANQTLPRNAVICSMDPRVFYLQRASLVGDAGYEVWLRWYDQESVEGVVRTLAQAGVTHLLVNWTYASRSQNVGLIGVSLERFQQLWRSGLAQRCRLLYEAEDVALYELKYRQGML